MANDALKAALLERAKREKQKRVTAAQQPASTQPAPTADMSLMGRVKDNLIGVDDGVNSFGENLATALNISGESMTLGVVGDEAAAAADAALGRGTYEERLDARRAQEAQFKDENPKTALVAELAPALIPGMGGAKLATTLAPKLGPMAAGAAIGSGAGATYGFMEGEGGTEGRAKQAFGTAVLGGLFGMAAPKVIDGLFGIPRALSRTYKKSQQRPTTELLKATKNQAYKAVDQSGEVFQPVDMSALHMRVSKVFDDGNFVAETDSASLAALKILERRKDQPTTLSQLDNVRQNLWKRYANAKDQPVLLDAIGEIDALIDSKSGASNLMAVARAANSRYAKSQLLDDAFQKARDQTAGSGSGGNIVNKYRQAVTSIINNKSKAKYFTEEEIRVMRLFVSGSTKENLQRLVGKLSPSGNGLMMALHVVGGMASQGASLPLMAVGAGAHKAAERSAMRGASHVQDVVSGFRPALPSPPSQINALQGATITGSTPALENALAGSRSRLGSRP